MKEAKRMSGPQFGNLVSIYHALDEGDWERLRSKPGQACIQEIVQSAGQTEEVFHPPIAPEVAAKRLKDCIAKEDLPCALSNVAALLIADCMAEASSCKDLQPAPKS